MSDLLKNLNSRSIEHKNSEIQNHLNDAQKNIKVSAMIQEKSNLGLQVD
jgi:hypothetical protein